MLVRVRPDQIPIGLHLTRISRVVSRAFDEALAEAGGSLPVWLALLNLKINRGANQRQLAQAVGVTEATLTHHLGAIEKEGLITRNRDPANRRNHVLTLTPEGEARFTTLAAAAREFDVRLRANLTDADLDMLRGLLDRLGANVDPGADRATGPLASSP
jgi:MarR family transcriptional regulator for hemolysin